jgi:hypothetical protein
MCFGDVVRELQQHGLAVTGTQVRWAITSGKVSRPPLDGSLRFDFGEQHLAELRDHFAAVAVHGRRRGRRQVLTDAVDG